MPRKDVIALRWRRACVDQGQGPGRSLRYRQPHRAGTPELAVEDAESWVSESGMLAPFS
jgi:hypothetical protein